MSNQVSFVFTDQSVTVSFPNEKDGQTSYVTKSVVKGSREYEDVVTAIKEDRLDDIQHIMSPADRVMKFSEGYIKVEEGEVYIHDKKVPIELSERILKFADEGLPYMPLVLFFENLSSNPSYQSIQQTFGFLEANHYPLTPDGCFVGYKKVRADFKDGHSGKFDNSPGQIVSMPRSEVDDNPSATCSYGLHVASYEYAHSYGGAIMIEVKINPRNVVAVPKHENEAKMRVCEYEVLGIAEEKHDAQLVNYSNAEQRDSWKKDRLSDWDNDDDDGDDDDDEYDDEYGDDSDDDGYNP